jgi:hypothetical protein
MFDLEQDLLHHDLALTDNRGRIEQDQTGHEPHDQIAAVGILSMHLAGLGRQEMFQGTERRLNLKPRVRRLRPMATRMGFTGITSKPKSLLPFISFFFLFLYLSEASFGASGVLWSAGMESGDMREWYRPCPGSSWCPQGLGGEFNSGNADSRASRDVAHTGQYSAKLAITTPPTAGVRLFRWGELQQYNELYFSAWYYFPERYDTPAGWWDIFQWKSKTPTQNDPFFIVNIGNRANGNMYLYMYDWQTHISYPQIIKDIPVAQWVRIEAFFRCAADGTGKVTVWQDGVQLFDAQNVDTNYANGECHWSIANYSDQVTSSPTTIYIDDAAISTTRIQ